MCRSERSRGDCPGQKGKEEEARRPSWRGLLKRIASIRKEEVTLDQLLDYLGRIGVSVCHFHDSVVNETLCARYALDSIISEIGAVLGDLCDEIELKGIEKECDDAGSGM